MDKPVNDDPLAAPIRGRYPDVVNAAIHFALRGDFRARRVTVGPRSAIITPERRPDGRIDGASIAAQVYAMCMDAYSALEHGSAVALQHCRLAVTSGDKRRMCPTGVLPGGV
jgi:hypothetical protein